MNFFQIASSGLAVVLMIPLCVGIWKKEVVQNPLTYLLWGILDAVAAIAAYRGGGNYQLAATLSGFAVLTVFLIIYAAGGLQKVGAAWTGVETLVSILAVFSIGALLMSTNENAAWLAIVSLMIASIPQIVSTWKDPTGTPSKLYLGFMVVNVLSVLGGVSFLKASFIGLGAEMPSVNDVGYGISGLVITSIIFFFSLKRR